MKNVYLVSTGNYSDYHIVAAFSKEEKAKKFIEIIDKRKKYESDEYDIEILELDKIGNLTARGYRWFKVTMLKDGTVKRVINEGFDSGEIYSLWDGNLHYTVLAKSEKNAVKIVNEKRIMLIALNRWEEPSTLAFPNVGFTSLGNYKV